MEDSKKNNRSPDVHTTIDKELFEIAKDFGIKWTDALTVGIKILKQRGRRASYKEILDIVVEEDLASMEKRDIEHDKKARELLEILGEERKKRQEQFT